MADARRGRYHPAFLSCLMLVVSAFMLLQYTYSGPAGSTRPALFKLRNGSVASSPGSLSDALIAAESLKIVPDSSVAPTGEENEHDEFAGEDFESARSSDDEKQKDDEDEVIADLPSVIEATGQFQGAEIERQENKKQLMSTSNDVANRVEQIELTEQDHEGVGDVSSPIERIGQVKEIESQESEEQPSDDANRVEQIELTEKEHDVEGSGDVQSVIEETNQVKEIEGKEQPMSTPSDEANRVEQIELVEKEHVIEGSGDVLSGNEEIGQVKGSESQDSEEQTTSTSSDDANRMEQIELVEKEHGVEVVGRFPSAVEETGQVRVNALPYELNEIEEENVIEALHQNFKQVKEIKSNEEPMTTSQHPFKISKEPKPSPIFQELQACKSAINDASQDSADPSLYKLLYKNVAAFSKSYELMEKVFKVYIYRDGRKPLVHTGPMVGIYASEGQFIQSMERASEYRTNDPSKAHMFFLPYSVQHMVEKLYVPNSHTMLPLATFIKEYVEALARKHPFWNRTQGADHFFVSCHDWGPATARDHPTLRSNAMKVVCNADTTEEFVVGKDASLPEVYIHKLRSKGATERLGGPRYDQRPYLAFFAGQMHGRVRPVLLSFWKDKNPDMKIYEVLPKHIARAVSYNQHMKLSKYCICAMGYEVNSPRIVEAIYHDCVPVIIADNFVLPFSDVLNWDSFSVTIPERDIPNLKSILSDIPEKNYRGMQRRLKMVRQHFIWHDPPQKYDAFHMILHSVWTSRLNRLEQIRESRSGELF